MAMLEGDALWLYKETLYLLFVKIRISRRDKADKVEILCSVFHEHGYRYKEKEKKDELAQFS